MALKEMIARVMRAVPAVAPGTIGENDIVNILNQAQQHLARLSSRSVIEEHTLAAGDDTVSMPVDVSALVSVYWKSDSIERELSVTEERVLLDREFTVSEPTHYYTKAGEIVVYPSPAIEGDVSVHYVPVPALMSEDTDTPDLKNCEEYLIAFALHRLHLEAGSPMLQLWEVEKMKEEHTFMQTSDQNYSTPIMIELKW